MPRTPKGPQSRHISGLLGHLELLPQQAGGEEPAALPVERGAIGKLMEVGQGFDVPPFEKPNDFGIWAVAEPPKGTLHNFPRRRGSACRCIRKASGAR
jgi:hypothetical protein